MSLVSAVPATMSPEARQRVMSLCVRITTERDRDKFTELVQELDVLLEFLHSTEQTQSRRPL